MPNLAVTRPRRDATARYLGWGRAAAGAAVLVSLLTDLVHGEPWFEAVLAVGGTTLVALGLLTLLARHHIGDDTVAAAALRTADLPVLGTLVAVGHDEGVAYTVVILLMLLTLAALRGMPTYRAAVAAGVVGELVRQGLLVRWEGGPAIDEALLGLGLAIALSIALVRMVEFARQSEERAVQAAGAATDALAEAERAAGQVDVLHRVVTSTIGLREDDALRQMVVEVSAYLDVPAATVVLLDAEGRPHVVATTDEAVAGRTDVAPIERGPFLHGPLARALAGRPTRATAPEREAMAAAGQPVHGDVAVVPLRRGGGTVVGALACGTERERTFSPTEHRTLVRVGDLMGLAIEAARSLDREAELAERYRDLDRLKTDFVAITSHELRTPLTTVLGVVETMRQRLDEIGPNELARLVHALGRQAQRLHRLVDDLSTVSRVDAGTLVTIARPTEVASVAKEAVAGLPDVATDLEVDPATPWAEADPDRLLQVFTNLIANGHQHGEGVVHVRVGADEHAREVVVRVWDHGRGIPEDRRDDVFERFVRLGATDQHSRGTGLGLAIARELVEAMRGSIAVVPQGDTTAFEVRLPAADAVT